MIADLQLINPENAQANPEAIREILNADMVIVGPGSLFTSVLPNLLVDGIGRAIEMSKALKVYICNVATERGETDTFSVSDHYEVLNRHVSEQLFTYVVANSNIDHASLPEAWHSEPVRIDHVGMNGATIVAADVVSEENRYHHDTKKLASVLIGLFYQRREIDQKPPQAQGAREKAAVS